MSWLFASPIDDLVEKATSEMIPLGQEDMALNLDICDRIRSKQVAPKEAMRSLKKRLAHKNPNVQLLALKLCDVCVKNGGSHFLAEIASREFVDSLVSMVNLGSINAEVKNKTLTLIQSWASAFKSRSELSYMNDTYNSLKNQGFTFPKQSEKTEAIMIDTTAPPDWTDSDVCERCRTLFTLTNRKHHCRNCGKTYCQSCSSKNLALPHLGINQEVRVCEACHQKLTGAAAEPASPIASPSAIRDEKGSISREEEELQRAIALSLLENENSAPRESATEKPAPKADSDLDPELAAAIAESLREMEVSKEKKMKPMKSDSYYDFPSSSNKMTASEKPAAPAPAQTPSSVHPQARAGFLSTRSLSDTETQNISLFAQLMQKLDSDPTGALAANLPLDRELRLLYDSMISMHPKLVKNIEECVEKHKILMDMYEKLSSSVRIYDRLLEERLANSYQQPAIPMGASGYPTQASSRYSGSPAHTAQTPYYGAAVQPPAYGQPIQYGSSTNVTYPQQQYAPDPAQSYPSYATPYPATGNYPQTGAPGYTVPPSASPNHPVAAQLIQPGGTQMTGPAPYPNPGQPTQPVHPSSVPYNAAGHLGAQPPAPYPTQPMVTHYGYPPATMTSSLSGHPHPQQQPQQQPPQHYPEQPQPAQPQAGFSSPVATSQGTPQPTQPVQLSESPKPLIEF